MYLHGMNCDLFEWYVTVKQRKEFLVIYRFADVMACCASPELKQPLDIRAAGDKDDNGVGIQPSDRPNHLNTICFREINIGYDDRGVMLPEQCQPLLGGPRRIDRYGRVFHPYEGTHDFSDNIFILDIQHGNF